MYSPAIRLPAALALFVALTGIWIAAFHTAVCVLPEQLLDEVEYERVM